MTRLAVRFAMVGVENPYQAPLAGEPESGPAGGMLHDLRGLARASLLLYAVATLLEIGDHVQRMTLKLPFQDIEDAHLHDTYYVAGPSPLSLAMMVCGFAGLALYFVWKHRAAWNARVLNPVVATVSPAMAVASYFIPLVNLVIPCQAMLGIARASGVDQRLVLRWWGTQMSTLVILLLGLFVDGTGLTLRPTLLEHIELVASVAAFVFSWQLVMRITRAQMAAVKAAAPA